MILFAGTWKKPSVDVVDHSLEALIGDSLPVNARHIVASMTHNGVNGNLVAAFSTDGLEGVPQSIKTPIPLDAQFE
jgi:hypothetical protein